jgi:tetrahydromethanopterin S-methyltransferase subunit G
MGSNKKKKSSAPANTNSNEYDLKSSLSKLNQRKDFPETQTSSNYKIEPSHAPNLNSESFIKEGQTETGIYFKINENINSRYDRLRDEIAAVNEKIGDSNDTLRQELEDKIEKKVGEKLFYGAVACLILIGGIIYAVSYSSLTTKGDSNEKDINRHDSRIEIIEKKVEIIDNNLKEVDRRLYGTEVEFRNSSRSKK